jgi:hypothetical protein
MPQAFTMPAASSRPPGSAPRVLTTLLPLIAVTVMAYLTLGLALPVLPLRVRQGLGLGPFVVGLDNPKMRPPASGDRGTFGRASTRFGRLSPAKGWTLGGASAARRANGAG